MTSPRDALTRTVLVLACLWSMPAHGAEDQIISPAIQCPSAPLYPASEYASWVAGSVVLQVTIDSNAKATQLTVTKSLGPAFDAAALEATSQCVFTPATRGGQPVAATIEMSVAFTLPPARIDGE